MRKLTKDPLLTIARGLLYFLMGAMAFGAGACVLAIPALLIMHDKVASALVAEMPAGMSAMSPASFIAAICAVLLLAIALLAVVFLILLLLKRIVDTVGEGDPFVPDNAGRLTRMAWLSLAVQLLSIPLGGLAIWLSAMADSSERRIEIDAGFSGNGLLLILILFILARVFRKGAEMRAELEGTV